MSRTVSTDSGSFESLKVSLRCGRTPKARQNRKILWIMLRQRQTKQPVWVPLHPTLHAEISTGLNPKSNLIAPSSTGKVWGLHDFAADFRVIRIEVGLPDGLQFRHLRRTAIGRLAETGASTVQIAAISGRSIEQTEEILEHYLPRNRLVALGAMDLLVERTGTIRRGFVLLQGRKGRTRQILSPAAICRRDLDLGTDLQNRLQRPTYP